jgi:hypothetical protein
MLFFNSHPNNFVVTAELPEYYLGKMMNYWYIKHHSEIEIGEKFPLGEFQSDIDTAHYFQEGSILWLSLLKIYLDDEIDVNSFNRSESEWTKQSGKYFVAQLLEMYFPIADPQLLEYCDRVIFSDLALKEWRESIKPQILSQFKELGIEA